MRRTPLCCLLSTTGAGVDYGFAVAAADDGRVAIAGESSDSDHRMPGQSSGCEVDYDAHDGRAT